MKLTKEEEKEKMRLQSLVASMGIPVFTQQHIRLSELLKKELHKSCVNPHCIGYNGTENESVCPNCNKPLANII